MLIAVLVVMMRGKAARLAGTIFRTGPDHKVRLEGGEQAVLKDLHMLRLQVFGLPVQYQLKALP